MEVDAFLADSVVAAEGKLYVQGAGWNAVFVQSFPARHSRVGIGMLIHVPYTATNQGHHLEMRIETQDGQTVPLGDAPPGQGDSLDGKIHTIRGDFNVGRPPLLPAGDEQVVPIAINIDGLMFERPDSYSVIISIDGTDMKRLPLRITAMNQLPGMP